MMVHLVIITSAVAKPLGKKEGKKERCWDPAMFENNSHNEEEQGSKGQLLMSFLLLLLQKKGSLTFYLTSSWSRPPFIAASVQIFISTP